MSTVKESQPHDPTLEELQHLQIFRQLDESDLTLMLERLDNEHYEMGKILFQTGEPYRKVLFILYRGRVGMWGPRGEKYEVDPGAVLGLSNFVDGLPFRFTAIALTPISLLVVREGEHQELARHCPPVHKMLLRLIAGRVARQNHKQLYVGTMTSPAKAFMKTPLATCGPEVSLIQAHQIMAERRIGSLVVTGQDEELLGVLTFPGLSEALLIKGATPHDNVMNVACQIAYAVSSDTPLWKVEEIQRRNTLKYVIVTDGKRPVGIIAQTDILNNLLLQTSEIRNEVSSADSFAKLGKLTNRIISIAEDAREHNHRTSAALRAISEFHLLVQRQCVDLTLQEMSKHGQGEPPEKFAVLIFGCGGRHEMMLNPDQHNGIIIGSPSDAKSKKTLRWFSEFATLLNEHLANLGYTYCPHDVMARNPVFTRTLEQWSELISELSAAPDKNARHWLKLFLDFDTLYGDDNLTETLRQLVKSEFGEKSGLLKTLVEDSLEWRPPLGFFEQLIPLELMNDKGGKKEKRKIDIDANGLNVLVNMLRIYALKAGVRNNNTIDRLAGLVRQGEMSTECANSIQIAYESLSDILLMHFLQQAEKGKRMDKLIKLKQLSTVDRARLRISMRIIKDLQEKVQTDFR